MSFAQSTTRLVVLAFAVLFAACSTRSREAPEAAPSVEWIEISHQDFVMRAAVARPLGRGPFPVIVILHGSHGFSQEYVRLAQDLATADLIAVAPCWFAGHAGEGARFVTPIDCPDAPPTARGDTPEAHAIVQSLVRAARTLNGADPNRIGLFGHSRGGGAALHYALTSEDIYAVAANSAGYPESLTQRAVEFRAPVLLLHGVNDNADEGGSTVTAIAMARAFEAAMRQAGRPVEAVYYPAGHNALFSDPVQNADAARRLRVFFGRPPG
jgi:carboxymethylenebutenolidase